LDLVPGGSFRTDRRWRAPAPANMARDEALGSCPDRPRPPSVRVPARDAHRSAGSRPRDRRCRARRADGLSVVRRPTGGQAVCNDNELTYLRRPRARARSGPAQAGDLPICFRSAGRRPAALRDQSRIHAGTAAQRAQSRLLCDDRRVRARHADGRKVVGSAQATTRRSVCSTARSRSMARSADCPLPQGRRCGQRPRARLAGRAPRARGAARRGHRRLHGGVRLARGPEAVAAHGRRRGPRRGARRRQVRQRRVEHEALREGESVWHVAGHAEEAPLLDFVGARRSGAAVSFSSRLRVASPFRARPRRGRHDSRRCPPRARSTPWSAPLSCSPARAWRSRCSTGCRRSSSRTATGWPLSLTVSSRACTRHGHEAVRAHAGGGFAQAAVRFGRLPT